MVGRDDRSNGQAICGVREDRARKLTRLLHLALLSRFSRMGQFHASEINFERQPRQIRAVCDSEQDFRNAGGCRLRGEASVAVA